MNRSKAGLSFLILSIYALVLTCDWVGSDFACVEWTCVA
jgi:hypothetical protein